MFGVVSCSFAVVGVDDAGDAEHDAVDAIDGQDGGRRRAIDAAPRSHAARRLHPRRAARRPGARESHRRDRTPRLAGTARRGRDRARRRRRGSARRRPRRSSARPGRRRASRTRPASSSDWSASETVGFEMPARREISAREIGRGRRIVSSTVRSLRCLSSGGVARAGRAVLRHLVKKINSETAQTGQA